MEQGQHIEKMAIVGDEKWQDDAFAFTPYHRTPHT
jgi:hypothetical protein